MNYKFVSTYDKLVVGSRNEFRGIWTQNNLQPVYHADVLLCMYLQWIGLTRVHHNWKEQLSWVFQKEVIPFLQQVFMPIVNAIFSALSLPVEENDEQGKREKQLLQRNYFQFIAAVVTNNISEVLNAQESQFLEQVMISIIRGAVDFPDPVVS